MSESPLRTLRIRSGWLNIFRCFNRVIDTTEQPATPPSSPDGRTRQVIRPEAPTVRAPGGGRPRPPDESDVMHGHFTTPFEASLAGLPPGHPIYPVLASEGVANNYSAGRIGNFISYRRRRCFTANQSRKFRHFAWGGICDFARTFRYCDLHY